MGGSFYLVKKLFFTNIRYSYNSNKNGRGEQLETNPQTSGNVEIVSKKEVTIRIVLNFYGVFAILGLILSIVTIPVSLDENYQFYFNKELMMGEKKIKEFLLFICIVAVTYFSFLNLYYKYFKGK
jgi:hypothetical protein